MIRDLFRRKILVLCEDLLLSEQISEPLRSSGYEVFSCATIKDANNLLVSKTPDMVIVNPEFSTEDGNVFFSHLSRDFNNCSAVIVGKPTDSEKLTQYLDCGANDFISIPFISVELVARVRTQFRLQDMRDLLFEANNKLQALVEIDDLTGLFNMRSLFQKLEFEIERAKRFSRPVTVIMMDIDKFKSVNDCHDHLFGSYVISEVGQIIRQCTRAVDIPARYGGDEFLIVLSEIPQAGVEFFCERLRKQVEDTHFKQGRDQIKLTLSIGFATFENGGEITPQELVRRADIALYEAKRLGRNQVVSYQPCLDRHHTVESRYEEVQARTEFSKKRKTA